MTHDKIHRIAAALLFVLAFVLYAATVAPTASFWDASERIAVAHGLQVPHPPGAPFYMLLGRLFSMFMPVSLVAVSINYISVLASALTVLLAYLIIVRLVREWRGDPAEWTPGERIATIGGGIIGALTLAVSDSFWFNAAEAETYATSTFFTALVVWLALKWSERVRIARAQFAAGDRTFGSTAERWLVLIAFVYGLAIGVHLLSLLAIFFVGLIVFYDQFEKPHWENSKLAGMIVLTGMVTSLCFFAIYPGITKSLPQFAASSGMPVIVTLGFIGLLVYALYYTHKNRMRVANLVVLCATVVVIGYSSYALIMVRSIASPPINQNDPSDIEAFVSYMAREQYGQRDLFRGPTFDNRTNRIDRTGSVLFPRRNSPEPHHLAVYAQYNSDMDFFLRYQLNEMYFRYLMWNFVGRASDMQGAPWITGISSRETDQYLYQTPSERAGRSYYFGLPFILALIGIAFHFIKDWRRALALAALFLVTGVGIILYLNQTPLQPRERDYSYAGSFFAFSLWVGIGAVGIMELVLDSLRRSRLAAGLQKGAVFSVGGILFLAVPLLMFSQNLNNHDRSGNYVAPEYAHNLLMSVEENAILFTNGDNDTFPLWYLQEVEGLRRDVRVANLSLLNTTWYIRQMLQQVRDSAPLPLSLTEQQARQIDVRGWQSQSINVPVQLDPQDVETGSLIPAGEWENVESPMRWTIEGRPFSEDFNLLWISDQVVVDLILENARRGWERPIYFAITVSRDNRVDLDPFFQLEGMAYRVVPIRTDEQQMRIVSDIMLERLNTFRFTNLDNPRVYFDSEIRRMMDNYRSVYAMASQNLIREGRVQEGTALLDTLMARIPLETIPADALSLIQLARVYDQAGESDRVVELMQHAEVPALHEMRTAATMRQIDRAAQIVQTIQFLYIDAGEFELASSFSNDIAEAMDDTTYRQSPEELRRRFARPETQLAEPVEPG